MNFGWYFYGLGPKWRPNKYYGRGSLVPEAYTFPQGLLLMILYAPRLPADPLARSECIRSFVCSLRALQAPCLGTTLGGTPPSRTPPPGTPPSPLPTTTPRDPPHPPLPPPTPLPLPSLQGPPHPLPPRHPSRRHPQPPLPNPTPPPASPSGRLFQVDGYSKWMVIPSAWLFRGHPTSTQNSNPANKDALRLSQCRKH